MYGRVTEWSNVSVLKTEVSLRAPWVRIPPLPPKFMRCLGLDIGTKKVGIAVSDESGIIAMPYDTVPTTSVLKYIINLTQEKEINTICFGNSKTYSQRENPIAKTVNYLKEELEKLGYKIFLIDENFTSFEARRIIGTKKKDNITNDARAAALILQRYLDSLLQNSG